MTRRFLDVRRVLDGLKLSEDVQLKYSFNITFIMLRFEDGRLVT